MDVSDIFYFFSVRGGWRGSPRCQQRGSVLLLKIPGGRGVFREGGGGRGAGRGVCGELGNFGGGGGAKYFFRGRNVHQDIKINLAKLFHFWADFDGQGFLFSQKSPQKILRVVRPPTMCDSPPSVLPNYTVVGRMCGRLVDSDSSNCSEVESTQIAWKVVLQRVGLFLLQLGLFAYGWSSLLTVNWLVLFSLTVEIGLFCFAYGGKLVWSFLLAVPPPNSENWFGDIFRLWFSHRK